MNRNWGFNGTDRMFKPSSMLIKKLVDCVSKGGNMILNVGPDARGNFPDESVRILHEIGTWMNKNGDSIYGCGASSITKPEYGRITQRGNTCYYHLYENNIGPVALEGVKKDRVKSIRSLATGYEIPISTSWVHSDYPDICFADLGDDPNLPDPVDYVLKVELRP
ncbi:MAG: alpha-L-fucosidase [Lachnospiraceae bacterium]|nr:alpha-L-fucosidase [Lachnospiraceae bacterium]